MKFLASQFAFLFTDREASANVRSLVKYLLFLVLLVALYTILFHVIKLYVEGERYSWITGVYWTLVVMSTLGFGDITFTTDIGRLFSVVVLLSGVVFLLVLLPFLFIRLFYAPWLEARIRLRAPRHVPPGTSGHVIIAEPDAVGLALAERLRDARIPYFVLEADPATAARFASDGISTIAGDNDGRATYERLETAAARLVFANGGDTTNTNIVLTVREVAPDVAVASVAENLESIDILELSGSTAVLPLKTRLGEYLANRVDAGRVEAHVIGAIRGVHIAELPARDTPFVGQLVRDTHLRERVGVSIVGLWERGKLLTAFPHTKIEPTSVIVLAGTAAHFASLERLLPEGKRESGVLVIGAGKVGEAAARFLKTKGLVVHAIDRQSAALDHLAAVVDGVFAGDAADRAVIEAAGINRVASVLLTTNDDAMNIYLAVYCRRLNPDLRIVSRITHERNVEAIHRAGADFALSYTSLGVESAMSLLSGHPPVLLGEGVELFEIPMPRGLAGRRLGDTAIGSRTGLSVVGLERGASITTHLTRETVLPADGTLLMLGSQQQREEFLQAFRQH